MSRLWHERVVSGLLVAANALVLLSIYFFAQGFFPYKPFLPGLADYETTRFGPPPTAPFNRVVFMVVDALRSDFVYQDGTGFTFTQSLIRDGFAVPFTANARSPTVTMPRIKALTTGSIPSFLDLVRNIDENDKSSALAAQDTWLAQMKAKKSGNLVMFGDDTWLKLFPETFDRFEGTSSFFVADFTEVDNNVTRHISEELEKDDWNTMVLHYLGLDHIGHKAGPRSVNMKPKQQEMDGIVRQIVEAMSARQGLASTLLVLCGDHGMNDAGNHGASSPGETSPALVFISPKLGALQARREAPVSHAQDFRYYSFVEQSDIVPTLGGLLGFPIPKNNLGVFIPDFLPLWPQQSDRIQIIVRNARQILTILAEASDTEQLTSRWQAIEERAYSWLQDASTDEQWIPDASEWLREAQDLLSSMASNFDLPQLWIGLSLAALSAAASLAAVVTSDNSLQSSTPLFLTTILYGVMMFASSYVEEEHHFFYWTTSALFAVLATNQLRGWSARRSLPALNAGDMQHLCITILALVATRLIRGWNQTGQKFAGGPDIAKGFIIPQPWFLWSLVTVTYTSFSAGLYQSAGRSLYMGISSGILLLEALAFKVQFTHADAPELDMPFVLEAADFIWGLSPSWASSIVVKARCLFLGMAGIACASVYQYVLVVDKQSNRRRGSIADILLHTFALLAATQSRATNIPLFLLFNLQLRSLRSQNLTDPEVSLASLLLQYMSFFAAGGTNAISSIDLSSAYNGVGSFDVAAVGILTFVGNWAGPMFWSFATVVLLLKGKRSLQTGRYKRHVGYATLFTTWGVASVMAACYVLRTHLFIWTVFSPKFLYIIAWSLGQHLLVNVLLGSALYWIGSRIPG